MTDSDEIARLNKENEALKAENARLKAKHECEHDWEWKEGVLHGVYQMYRKCKKCWKVEEA